MITADTDGIGPRQFLHGVFNGVTDQTNRRPDGKDPCPPADHLFQNVVLRCCAHPIPREAVSLGGCLKHGEHHACHRVDGEADTNPVEGNAFEGHLEVAQGIDSHAHSSDFTLCKGIIRIQAHLGGEIEGHIEACLAVGDHELKAFVRLLRGSKTGVLTGRPLPASITQRMNASCERILSGKGEILLRVEADLIQVLLGIERFDVDSGLEDDIRHFVFFVLGIPCDTHDSSENSKSEYRNSNSV